MLNDPTVHIYNIHTAIGAVGKVYGAKPFVQRGEELLSFPSLFCRRTVPVKSKYISLYQIGLRDTDKNILIITVRECPSPINQWATSCGNFQLYTILVQYTLFVSTVYGYRLCGIHTFIVRQSLIDPFFRNIVLVADQPIGQYIIAQ